MISEVSLKPLLDLKCSFFMSSSLSMEKHYSLTNYSALHVSGERSVQFLQGQATSNLLVDFKKKDTLFCDEKGFVIAKATIFNEKDLIIITKTSTIKFLQNHLNRFIRFYKCSMSVSEIGVHGIESKGCFSINLGEKIGGLPQEEWDLEKLLSFDYDIDGEDSAKLRYFEIGYDPKKYISFDKGCYTGQELIARYNFLSKKNKSLYIFKDLQNEEIKKIRLDHEKIIFSKFIKGNTYSQYSIKKIGPDIKSLNLAANQ